MLEKWLLGCRSNRGRQNEIGNFINHNGQATVVRHPDDIRRHDEARYAVGNSRQVVVQRAYSFPSGSWMRPSAIAVLLPL